MTYLENPQRTSRIRRGNGSDVWCQLRQTNNTWTTWFLSSFEPEYYYAKRLSWYTVSEA